jgi:glycosyltransferase involved in cell wall biosynthesis
MDGLPLSVAIISFNEEDNIARTLESIHGLASEIVVVDSHSTDRTREIARDFGAEVWEEDWKGHVRQKNSALDKCGQAYVLALDCDEVLSSELRESIREAVRGEAAEGFSMNRKTFYLGRFLEHTWQPEWRLRLVKSSAHPKWGGYDPHDHLTVEGRIQRIKGDLHHYSYRDIGDHFNRAVTYPKLSARAYHGMGRRFRVYNLLFNPMVAFVKVYFLKLGFLDGVRALSVAGSEAFSTFLKYLYLWEIERSEGRSKGEDRRG